MDQISAYLNANWWWILIAIGLVLQVLQVLTRHFSEHKGFIKVVTVVTEILSIFRSKSGNLVAFLRAGGKYKRATKAGRRRGDLKGRLLFVLKYEVRVKGTDALAQAVRDKRRLLTDNLNAALRSATGDS